MQAPELSEAVALADAAGTVREAAAALRTRFAPMKVVVVDAFDMRGETPAGQGARRLLWLGASDGHCWQVTPDVAQAAGFFLADAGAPA
ncbi:hypothetical protein [Sphaerotilus montanus]|jgi:hypothetical protein|uniref:hypothetical protein n=1 Tax=Sphaerotilus montanus TaxID=522889 RepID=UPI003FA259AB